MNAEERVLWNQIKTKRAILESSLDWLIIRQKMGFDNPEVRERLELVHYHHKEFLECIDKLKSCCKTNNRSFSAAFEELDALDRAVKDAFRAARMRKSDKN